MCLGFSVCVVPQLVYLSVLVLALLTNHRIYMY